MRLHKARSYVSTWLRGESAIAYNALEIDRAILVQIDDFCRRTGSGWTIDGFEFIATDDEIDVSGTSCTSDRFISAYIESPTGTPQRRVQLISSLEFESLKYRRGYTASATPEVICFTSPSTALLKMYPAASAAGTLFVESIIKETGLTDDNAGIAQVSFTTTGGVVQNDVSVLHGGYYESTPAVTFTASVGSGAAGTATITDNILTGITITNGGSGYTSAPVLKLNGVDCSNLINLITIPDDVLRKVLMYGVPAILQSMMPQEPYAAISLAKYEQHVLEYAGRNSQRASAIYSDVCMRPETRRVDIELE